MKNKTLSLILWYLPILFVQMISGSVTMSGIDPWYKDLEKASWNPPSWVFGPVWTILYLLMAISVWMIYWTPLAGNQKQRRKAYTLFFLQLGANGLWSFLFFGAQIPGWALIDLTLLIILTTMTMIAFYRIRPLASLLMVPYLLWSCYAFSLNAVIWWLN